MKTGRPYLKAPKIASKERTKGSSPISMFGRGGPDRKVVGIWSVIASGDKLAEETEQERITREERNEKFGGIFKIGRKVSYRVGRWLSWRISLD